MVKGTLEKAMGIRGEIAAIEQERRALKALAENATSKYRFGGRKKGNNASKVEIGAVHLLELEEKLMSKQVEYAKAYDKVSDTISQLEDPTQRTILRLRYLYGAPWKLICHETHYSWGGVHNKHNQALTAMEVLMMNMKH